MMSNDTRDNALAVLTKRLDQMLNTSGAGIGFVLLLRTPEGDLEILSNCSLHEEVKLIVSQALDAFTGDDIQTMGNA